MRGWSGGGGGGGGGGYRLPLFSLISTGLRLTRAAHVLCSNDPFHLHCSNDPFHLRCSNGPFHLRCSHNSFHVDPHISHPAWSGDLSI